MAPDAVLPPFLPPNPSYLDPVSPERWQGSPAMTTETLGAGALLHHAYLQLLDHSLYEEGPELHPLQALLGQADGVEDSSRDPVPLLRFRWRVLLHDALENTGSTPQKGAMCAAHTVTTHRTKEAEVLAETLVYIPTPRFCWLRSSVLKTLEETISHRPAHHLETCASSASQAPLEQAASHAV